MADGTFVMDSEDAAAGIAALRDAAPERAAELAVAVQRAFFVDGDSLSDVDTYRRIADAAGLDATEVAAAFAAPRARHAAQADFRRAGTLGVDSYPTLLGVSDDGVTLLARGLATVEDIERHLATTRRTA
jgi:putative protein-disulfide isomerase